MGLPFIGIILIILALAWLLGASVVFLFRKGKRFSTQPPPETPARRLADQWLSQALGRLEEIPAVGPDALQTAAHELLELRLEAGRVAEGAKALRLARRAVREGSAVPRPGQDLAIILRNVLGDDFVRPGTVEGSFLIGTPMGELPICVLGPDNPSEAACRSRVNDLAGMASQQVGNPLAGGFLFIPHPETYGRLAGPRGNETVELLRAHRILPLDAQGLLALLSAASLSQKTDRVMSSLSEAVKAVEPLVGQSEKVGAALAALNAQNLKTRVQHEERP